MDQTPQTPPNTDQSQAPTEDPQVYTENLDNDQTVFDEQPVTQDTVTWTAVEFVLHEKAASWYTTLFAIAAGLAAIAWLLMKDVVAAGVVVFAAVLLAIYAERKPRELDYAVTPQGFSMGNRHHAYEEFRAFSVVTEADMTCVNFVPLKRFAVPISIYCQPDLEDAVLGVLSNALPYEEHKPDVIESILRGIRF
jgi:hypothetical protein